MDLVGNTVAAARPLLRAARRRQRSRRRSARGKIDFFTSRPFWSDRGWGGCWSCHPDGRTDTVTWSFEAGPRQTISLDGTFNHLDPEDQRALNWSPVRDENQDFELNTRGVFGGRGFITVDTDLNADGLMPDSDPNVRNFGPASSGRAQQQEDITAYIQLGIRSADRAAEPPAAIATRGRDIFGARRRAAPTASPATAAASGRPAASPTITADVNPVPGTDTGIVNIPPVDLDSNGTIDETESKAISVFLNGFNSAAGAGRICEVPPPPGGNSERIRIVRQVGTFTAANPIEVRSNAISPVNTVAPALTVAAAFGGDGFNAPSLLGVFDSAPYFHNGAVADPRAAVRHRHRPDLPAGGPAHWRAGTGGNCQHPRQRRERGHRPDRLRAARIDEQHRRRSRPPIWRRTIRSSPTPPRSATAQKDPPLGTPALDCRP